VPTKPQRTTLYLPPELWKAAKIQAIKRNCTATDIVTFALAAYLKATGEKSVKEAIIDAQQKAFIAAVRGLREPTKGKRGRS
jgi:hypothetical protein